MTTLPPTPRSTPVLMLFLGIAGVTLLFGVVMMLREGRRPATSAVLTVYCAAGLRAPVEAVAREYEKETGSRVDLSFGGSHTLLANIEVSKTGDVYIPGDESYIALASEKKLTAETVPVASMSAQVAVAKGNPKKIGSVADLTR